jgi:hypothetical protein
MNTTDAETELRLLNIPDDVLGFCRAMFEAEAEGFDWLYFLEKPWKWAAEFAGWVSAGKPIDASHPNFDQWADSLE